MNEYFQFLNVLRAEGAINMFEAPSWLQDYYGLTQKEAKAVFVKWIMWGTENPANYNI